MNTVLLHTGEYRSPGIGLRQRHDSTEGNGIFLYLFPSPTPRRRHSFTIREMHFYFKIYIRNITDLTAT